jgi:hypothetical protein
MTEITTVKIVAPNRTMISSDDTKIPAATIRPGSTFAFYANSTI